MFFQSQAPPSQSGGKTEAEIKEEEDLQLALALSQSEAEEKEKLKLKNTSTILAGAAAKTNNTAVSSAVEEKVRNVFVFCFAWTSNYSCFRPMTHAIKSA